MKIETQSGIYEIRKPVGRIGAKHIALLTRASKPGIEPGTKPEDIPPELLKEFGKDMSDVFELWSESILPKLLVTGPFSYEEMPGEDQYAVFIALASELQVGDDLFRIVQ